VVKWNQKGPRAYAASESMSRIFFGPKAGF